jgi:hypothetical protein
MYRSLKKQLPQSPVDLAPHRVHKPTTGEVPHFQHSSSSGV